MGSMMNEEENSTPALDLASALKRTLEAHNRVVSNYEMIEAGLREELEVERSFKGELRQTIHNQREARHKLLRKVYSMRNCHNCNERGCKEASDEKLGGECMDNDRKYWEHGQ